MNKSYKKCNVFRKQDVELSVKQSDVGRGVSVDNGSSTASYTTCPPIDVDDMAEWDDDYADDIIIDEFDDFDETDGDTGGMVGSCGDWDGASGVMETEVAAPGSSSTPKTKKANAKTRQKKKAPGRGKGQKVVKWSREERLWLWECIC